MTLKPDVKIEIEGNLEAMDLPTLIQFIGQEGEAASINIESESGTGSIFINEGLMCHAVVIDGDNHRVEGEDALFELLKWEKGHFKLLKKVEVPVATIQKPWDFILMEGLRKLDEAQAGSPEEAVKETVMEGEAENSADKGLELFDDLSGSTPHNKDLNKMANLEQTLNEIMNIGGAKAAALVDWESGMTLGTVGGGFDIDLAAAGNTNVVRAKFDVMKQLKLKGGIEDILITLTDQYHLIRIMESNVNLFIYVALDRTSANLGMARHQLSKLEQELEI